MNLRLGTMEDYPVVIEMARKFYEATPYYGVVPYNETKMSNVVLDLLGGSPGKIMILAEVDGDTVGMVGGQVSELLVSDDKIAMEVAWYVHPDHRRSKVSIELLGAFEYWATQVAGCKYLQLSCLEDEAADRIQKFYKRKGYRPFERFFIKAT